MIAAKNTVGIGPWSFDVGPFIVVVVAVIIGIVIYAIRQDR